MGEYIADERTLGMNRARTKGMGPGASVVSTGWSDQVRFFQLEGGGGGGHSAEFAQYIKWGLAACCEDLNMKKLWASSQLCGLEFVVFHRGSVAEFEKGGDLQ
jgi:hypothetical protein